MKRVNASRSVFLSVVLGLVMSVLSASGAFANGSSSDTWVYQGQTYNDPVCERTLSSVSDLPAGGEIVTQSQAYYYFLEIGTPCVADEFGAGQLAVAEDLWKWTGSEWAICNAGDIYYNDVTEQTLQTGWDFGGACGSGYSGDNGRGWAYDQLNGAWRGGTYIWSGYQYVN